MTNPSGNRPCEAALNRDFRRFEAGTHPANTGLAWFADGGAAPGCLPHSDWISTRTPRHRAALSRYIRTPRPWHCSAFEDLKYKFRNPDG